MSTRHYILHPHVEVDTGPAPRAARLTSLRGATLALIDNDKPQAGVFLDELGAVLRRDHGVADTFVIRKSSAGRHITEAQLSEIRDRADAAVSGVGD